MLTRVLGPFEDNHPTVIVIGRNLPIRELAEIAWPEWDDSSECPDCYGELEQSSPNAVLTCPNCRSAFREVEGEYGDSCLRFWKVVSEWQAEIESGINRPLASLVENMRIAESTMSGGFSYQWMFLPNTEFADLPPVTLIKHGEGHQIGDWLMALAGSAVE